MTHPRARGFTLIETVLAMAILSLVLGGVASAIVIAGRAVPSASDPGTRAAHAAAAIDELMADISVATGIAECSASACEFTLPDWDSDGDEETIRYEVKGTLLVRTVNGSSVTVLEDVADFAVAPLTDDADGSVRVRAVSVSVQVGDAWLHDGVRLHCAPELP